MQALDIVEANNLSDKIIVLHNRVEVSSFKLLMVFASICLL